MTYSQHQHNQKSKLTHHLYNILDEYWTQMKTSWQVSNQIFNFTQMTSLTQAAELFLSHQY